MGKINFFSEDVEFKTSSKALKDWLKNIIFLEGYILNELNFIFCSDMYLHAINQTYLNHNTFTDIITFNNSDNPKSIEGDIYISIERVMDNSKQYNVDFSNELHRVMAHGVLHLVGYRDKTKKEKQEMRIKEDTYLSLQSVPRGTRQGNSE